MEELALAGLLGTGDDATLDTGAAFELALTALVGTNNGATFQLDGFRLDGELPLAILEAAEETGLDEMAVAGL